MVKRIRFSVLTLNGTFGVRTPLAAGHIEEASDERYYGNKPPSWVQD